MFDTATCGTHVLGDEGQVDSSRSEHFCCESLPAARACAGSCRVAVMLTTAVEMYYMP